MSLIPGDRLGPYEMLGTLGKGGMGEVYRARDPRLGRDIAIKVLHADKLSDASRRERFMQEARAASSLNHPGIVTIHDIGSEGDRVYMVMELIDGKALDSLIPNAGYRIPEVLRIAIQIADAFGTAHAAGIVHRDLKPANVMLTNDGRVKVLDFGLAKLVDSAPALSEDTRTVAAQTAEGTVMGTAAYMSPEQAEAKPLDARSDIFSFGAVLYELCTGQRAFQGDTRMSVIAAVIREEPPPAASLRKDLPPELARIIQRCMRKNPARRAQSMADLKCALEDLKEESDSGKLSGPIPVAKAGAKARASWPLVAGIAVLLLAGGFFGWRAWSGGSEPAAVEAVPFTTYAGAEEDPEFSPDGNQVAFAWNGESRNNWDVYIKLIGSGTPLRLTTDKRPEDQPRWSPDGRMIAFRRRLDRERIEILLIPALGGPERKVGEYASREDLGNILTGMCWTPDSRHLIVTASQTPGEPNRLILVSLDSDEVKTLAQLQSPALGYSAPQISPDGRMLGAVAVEGSRKIHVWPLSKNLELGAERTLDTGVARMGVFRWTADSRDLVFDLFLSAPIPLYRMPVNGGVPRPLRGTEPGVNGSAISPVGNRMVFVRTIRDANIWEVDLQVSEQGQTTRQVAVSTSRDVAPDYSWDGKRLAFYSNRAGSVQVWTANADGSGEQQLTSMNPQATTGTPRWSPDGKRILFDSDSSGAYQVYVTNAAGGRPRPITTGPSANYIGSWTPDGRWIYFTSMRSGQAEIWRVSPEGGQPEQVTREGGTAPYVARDGKWVYFTKGQQNALWRMPLEGGQGIQLTDSVFRYSFALGPKGVYWVPWPNPDGTSSVRFLDTATGVSKEVVKIAKQLDLGLAVSPDGSKLLFVQRDYTGEDLMLVENFK